MPVDLDGFGKIDAGIQLYLPHAKIVEMER
jgi:hypothetical protein